MTWGAGGAAANFLPCPKPAVVAGMLPAIPPKTSDHGAGDSPPVRVVGGAVFVFVYLLAGAVAGETVVGGLPGFARDAEVVRLRGMQEESGGNVAVASHVAKRLIEKARAEGEPRFYGMAEAALAAWWKGGDVRADVLLLRATLKQQRHDFAGASGDLDLLLEREPENAGGLALKGTILQLRGDFEAAREVSQVLERVAPGLVAAASRAALDGMTGDIAGARKRLEAALEGGGDRRGRAWALAVLADLAERGGDRAAAEVSYRQALELNREDGYVLGAYADLLLRAGREEAVIALLEGKEEREDLGMRLVLAERAAYGGSAKAAMGVGLLASRLDALARRGCGLHAETQARFLLEIDGDAAGAVDLVRSVWEEQKEPAVLRVLAEAAVAAGDQTVLDEIEAWVRATGYEDAVLEVER